MKIVITIANVCTKKLQTSHNEKSLDNSSSEPNASYRKASLVDRIRKKKQFSDHQFLWLTVDSP